MLARASCSRAERMAMIDEAGHGRMVGMELAASAGTRSELAARVEAWNDELMSSGAMVAYASASADECDEMCALFFAHEDSGTALEGDPR